MSAFIPIPFPSYLEPRKYLSDPTEDVRIAAENQLAEFLREIREVTIVRKHREEEQGHLRETKPEEKPQPEIEQAKGQSSDISAMPDTERAPFLNDNPPLAPSSEADKPNGEDDLDMHERDVGGTFHLCVQTDTHFVQIGSRVKVFESTTMQ